MEAQENRNLLYENNPGANNGDEKVLNFFCYSYTNVKSKYNRSTHLVLL